MRGQSHGSFDTLVRANVAPLTSDSPWGRGVKLRLSGSAAPWPPRDRGRPAPRRGRRTGRTRCSLCGGSRATPRRLQARRAGMPRRRRRGARRNSDPSRRTGYRGAGANAAAAAAPGPARPPPHRGQRGGRGAGGALHAAAAAAGGGGLGCRQARRDRRLRAGMRVHTRILRRQHE